MLKNGTTQEPEKIIKLFCQYCLQTTDWHYKIELLSFFELFLFKNLYFLSKEITVFVINKVLQLLIDPQIEVRKFAKSTLTGLLKLLSSEQKSKLQRMLELISKIQLNRKIRSQTERQDLIARKHGGILGLSAFLNSNPYNFDKNGMCILKFLDTIEWTIPLIKTEIHQTFSDFFRTHEIEYLKSQLSKKKYEKLILLKYNNQRCSYFR